MTDDNSTSTPSEETPSGKTSSEESQPRWQALGPIDRRVVGVLAEKAKTTPDAYPMSLNAIRNGCNQKSNRVPMMNLDLEDLEEALDRLRQLGAVGMIEGYGRVTKYRHYLYEWLAVGKAELAVMAELLLRGAQTEGELRGRAARMEPIKDLSELRPILTSLKAKGLVIALTPEGRGHSITHALYREQELEKLRAQYGRPPAATVRSAAVEPAAVPAEAAPPPGTPRPAPAEAAADLAVIEALRRQLEELRCQVSQLRSDFDDLSTEQRRIDDDVRELRDALGG